jgi:hypothetical protein
MYCLFRLGMQVTIRLLYRKKKDKMQANTICMQAWGIRNAYKHGTTVVDVFESASLYK